jgi:hypothetical protein
MWSLLDAAREMMPCEQTEHILYATTFGDSGNALAATEQSGGNRREEAMVGIACRPPVRANPKRWFVQFPLHTSNDAQEAY